MNDYIVVSFATKDGKYDKYGTKFEQNMKDLNISYDIEYIDPIKPDIPNKRLLNKRRQKKDTGRTRAKFLTRKLKEHDKTIVWMDCDDGFREKPKIKDKDFDVGFITTEPEAKYLPIMARILILNPTNNAFHFLKVWDYLNSWPELEPIGGSHLRLCAAKYICFDLGNRNPMNFKQADLTNDFYFKLKINRNR